MAVVALLLSTGGCRGGDTTSSSPGVWEMSDVDEIRFDYGVTEEPCPEGIAVNPGHGCIYLGVLSDLTVGPFADLGVAITEGHTAFWRRVNEQGGIGGFDVDTESFVRDNQHDRHVQAQVYEEVKGEILALAQTLGSPTTAAVIDDMRASDVLAVPTSWTSAWAFEDVIVESGTNYCFEAMNTIDYAVETYRVERVLVVHYAGEYGDDAAAGARAAAEANDLRFATIRTVPGTDNQADAIAAIVEQQPELVLLATGPSEVAVIVGETVGRGFGGRFIGTGASWNAELLQTPAAEALTRAFELAYYWPPWDGDTRGHAAMRAALDGVAPHDGYTAGWIRQYPLKAALEQAVANRDLSREGLIAALQALESVDYEGMLPTEAGNFAGPPDERAYRASAVYRPDPQASTGMVQVRGLVVGPTAAGYDFTAPCFE
jgi:ABC-type branched-subunit amino acid transport system substrate-binding protein